MLKTAVALRHVHFEDLGAFEGVLARRGYKVHYYDVGVDDLWTLEPVKTALLIVPGVSPRELRAAAERHAAAIERRAVRCLGTWLDGLGS